MPETPSQVFESKISKRVSFRLEELKDVVAVFLNELEFPFVVQSSYFEVVDLKYNKEQELIYARFRLPFEIIQNLLPDVEEMIEYVEYIFLGQGEHGPDIGFTEKPMLFMRMVDANTNKTDAVVEFASFDGRAWVAEDPKQVAAGSSA